MNEISFSPFFPSFLVFFLFIILYYSFSLITNARRTAHASIGFAPPGVDVQRAGPARPAARAGHAGTARGGPRRATGRPCRATTVLRAEGAAHGPVRGPFSRAVPPVQLGTSGRPTARQAYHRLTVYEKSMIQFQREKAQNHNI